MYCTGYYQTHHHVHWTDFDWVDSVNKLLDLVKGGPMGGDMSTAAPNQLQKQTGQKMAEEVREISCDCKFLHVYWIHSLVFYGWKKKNFFF